MGRSVWVGVYFECFGVVGHILKWLEVDGRA